MQCIIYLILFSYFRVYLLINSPAYVVLIVYNEAKYVAAQTLINSS